MSTAQAIRAGRRAEARARRPWEAARHDAPSAGEFGDAEYVDDEGREYRVALTPQRPTLAPGEKLDARTRDTPLIRNGAGHVKVWLRLKKNTPLTKRAPWPSRAQRGGHALRLWPQHDGLRMQWTTIRSSLPPRTGGRTGTVYMSGWE